MLAPPRSAPLALAAALALACAPADDERVDRAAVVQAIQGGVDDAETGGVVALRRDGGTPHCSGALVDSALVLTARHCVAATSGEPFRCDLSTFGENDDPATIEVTNRAVASPGAAWRAVASIHAAPGPGTLCGHDLALLALSAPLDAAEGAPLVPRVDVPVATGEGYAAVGYGNTTPTPIPIDAGRRRRRDGLTAACGDGACVGDDVDPQREWRGEAGVCPGDSGGPAIDAAGRVIGVVSRGATLSCDAPVHGSVHAWGAWLRETAAAAANARGAVPPPWALGEPTDPDAGGKKGLGEPCGADAECADDLCVGDGDDRVCTRRCDEADPCPAELACHETERVCVRSSADLPAPLVPGGGCAARRGLTPGAPASPSAAALLGLVALAVQRGRRRGGAPA